MAKKFKSNETAMKFIIKDTQEMAEDVLEDVSKRFAADTNDQFVPELTADLKNSVFKNSDFENVSNKKNEKKAILRWVTPYARRRFFEGSITGVAFWTIENVARNAKVYNKMIIDRLKRR